MGRRLPWKIVKSENAASVAVPAKSLPSLPSLSLSHQDDEVNSVGSPASRRHQVSHKLATARSPSTSPPPEPLKEESMIPGPRNDDRYRMVEDEFLHMAQKFTAHLHRAEYDRLRTVAKSRNAETIQQIERPVVPTEAVPWLTKRRKMEASKAKKQQSLLGSSGRSNYEPLPTGLSGLLDSPSKEGSRSIRSYVAEIPNTRAAAGFKERASEGNTHSGQRLDARRGEDSETEHASSPGEDNDDDDDDDDLAVLVPARRSAVHSRNVPAEITDSTARTRPTRSPTRAAKVNSSDLSRSRDHFSVPTAAIREPIEDDDVEDDDPFGIKKRKMKRLKLMETAGRPN